MPDEKSELEKIPAVTAAKAETTPTASSTPPSAKAALVGDPTPSPTPPVKPAVPAAAKPAAAVAKPAAPAAPPKPAPIAWESPLVAGLKRQYGSGIREAASYLKDKYLVVDKSIVFDVLNHMRDEQFDYCVDITAVHWPKREEQFDVIYILYSFEKNERVRVETTIKDGEKVRSAYSLWPTSDWLEREVFDMYGIEFTEHPGLKRILLPEGWTGHPLRKDYGIRQQDQAWVKQNIGIESGQ
ncbi:MAG TPA: NADH-quinone oxidoreductase subunit C [Candidatus Koribacter sp.]|jgi:NADH-quinone oxidoreductase subunit C